jgi:hypothetical protein
MYKKGRMAFSLKNIFKKKPKILLYTDSRGKNLPYKGLASHAEYNTYEHYNTKLAKIYNVDAYLMPERVTTCVDFIKLTKQIEISKYDAIVLHTGVVDASPRPRKSMINEIYPDKSMILNEIFSEEKIYSHINSELEVDYEGDKTINLYSLDMAKQRLLPILNQFDNLIWISSNPVITNWRGTYWKDRPANIKLIEDYAHLFLNELNNSISLMEWNDKHVMDYTFDNIHLNKKGSDYLFKKIVEKIEEII